jgi:large repetitive protein
MGKKFLFLLLVLVIIAGFSAARISPLNVQASALTAVDDFTMSKLDSNIVNEPLSTATVLSIATEALKDGDAQSAYSQTLKAINGVSPYKWSKSGILPAGLTLNAKTGLISGKPIQSSKTAKIYSLTIKVTDSAPRGYVQTASKTFRFTIYPPLDIARLLNADARSYYSCQISASGGKPPYS